MAQLAVAVALEAICWRFESSYTYQFIVANKLTEMSIRWIRNIRLRYFNEYWHTYTPDFYLPIMNAFIEVKGYYPDEDKLKMQLVLKYNPDVKIYFIGQCQYKEFLDNGILKNEYLMKLN
jgi:hypothetical protein